MLNNYIADQILKEVGFEPTGCQREMAGKLADFITSDRDNQVFLLKGYAGTGKTISLLKTAFHLFDTEQARVFILTYNHALASDLLP